jgi:NAD dependent epimerase/dehydratase family enzyme
LDAEKGALPKMAAPIKKWIGSPIGSGKQNMNWVHIDDLITIFIHVIDNSLEGTFNVVGGSNTNEEFTRTLAKTLHKPLFLPNVPPFILKWMLGEMAILLLNGNFVSGKKLIETGFNYRHTELEETLKSIYTI